MPGGKHTENPKRCTEAQKKAQKKYNDKLKEQGKTRDHGNKEATRQRVYILRAYKWLPKIFNGG